jgi:hypothetical protein
MEDIIYLKQAVSELQGIVTQRTVLFIKLLASVVIEGK